MAVKDEKMADADAEQAKLKKQKQKKKGQKGVDDKEADLSEEDLELKKNLELMLERAKDTDAGVQRTALDGIAREIRSEIRVNCSVKQTPFVAQLFLAASCKRHGHGAGLLPRAPFALQRVHNINDLSSQAPEVFEITLQGTQRSVRGPASQQQKQSILGRYHLCHGHHQRKGGSQGKLAI